MSNFAKLNKGPQTYWYLFLGALPFHSVLPEAPGSGLRRRLRALAEVVLRVCKPEPRLSLGYLGLHALHFGSELLHLQRRD